MDPLQCSSSQVDDVKWHVWNVDKVICQWQVDVTSSKSVKSHSFGVSASTLWCIELYEMNGGFTLSLHLLWSQSDPSIVADLKVSVMWEGAESEEQGRRTVTLSGPGRFNVLWSQPYNVLRCMVHTEVNITSDVSRQHKEQVSFSCDQEIPLYCEDFSDILLCAGDAIFRAHRAVLCARSPVFAAILQEAQKDMVHITDVEPDTLREVLRYIYTGQTCRMSEIADQLLAAAHKYRLLDLKGLCEQELVSSLTVQNAAATGVIALKYSSEKLKQYVVSFIQRNILQVLKSDGWADSARHNTELFHKLNQLVYGQPYIKKQCRKICN